MAEKETKSYGIGAEMGKMSCKHPIRLFDGSVQVSLQA